MGEKFKISVITASYNYGHYIADTIESVINQKYRNWELIIIDDGSSDNSAEIIETYRQKDNRIQFYTHPGGQNHGLPATMQLALDHCTGDYIAFLESDDIWTENNLTEKAKVIKTYPRVGIIANDVELFGDANRIAGYAGYFALQEKIWSKRRFPCNIFSALLKENLIPTFSCVMIKSEYLRECRFDVDYPPWLDRYLWLRIAYRQPFYFLAQKLTRWRIHPCSYISKEANAYKKDNNQKIKSLICYAFENEKNMPVKLLKILFYYHLTLLHKYVRALLRRISKA